MNHADDSIELPLPPAPVPCSSPHELKARMLADYHGKAGAFGMPTDPLAIERLVVHDLNLVAGYKRDEAPLPAPTEPTAEERQAKRDRAQAQLAEDSQGKAVILPPSSKPRDMGPMLDLPPSVAFSERWLLARGRLNRIMEGAGPPQRHPDGTLDVRSMALTANYPRGAARFIEDWLSFDFRGVWQTRNHNPFYGMSHRDASLKFVARAMDICDSSTGTSMGQWFVPK